MSEVEVVGTHRMPDGTEYRVGLRRDDEPQEPYDDGGWPILQVEYKHYDYVATAFNKQAEPYVDKFNELFERLRELRTWERFAKIFLGSKHVHEYGFNRGTDYSYIAFDTPEWRENVGAPEDLSKEKPLAEIQAWIEGEVYGWIVQTRYNPDEELAPWEDWETQDSCYGFYGSEWAKEAALEALKEYVAGHKVVHRYTEHEKIDAHDSEIRAILEFLETHTLQGHTAVRGGHQQMVFEHFGIDYSKIEQERELMFKRLQQDAAIQAGLSIKKAQEATDK